MIKIIDTKPGDDAIQIVAIINNVVTGKTNGANKSNYLSITLQDQTGSVDAKLWSASDVQLKELVAGVVVQVEGDVIKYNIDKQLKISKITIVSTDSNEQVKYLKQAPVTEDVLVNNVQEYINNIENRVYFNIVNTLYERNMDRISKYPAASKNHHEYVSGLLHHVVGMLNIAKSVCLLHPSIDKDLLYSGVLLHDLGKIIELSGPVLPEYTLEGKLLGHISITQAMIKQVGDELGFDSEEVTLLQHMILSHHGKNEFGSPVIPLLKEAELLHLIDNMDARINMLDKALEQTDEGTFTKRVFSLENRSFYKPKKNI